MNGGVKLDMRAFNDGMRRKLAVTKRAVPVVVNQASKNVCLRAIAFTPKADPKQIEAQLTQNGFAFRLLQSKSFQARLPRKLQGFHPGHAHPRADQRGRAATRGAAPTFGRLHQGGLDPRRAGVRRCDEPAGQRPELGGEGVWETRHRKPPAGRGCQLRTRCLHRGSGGFAAGRGFRRQGHGRLRREEARGTLEMIYG